MNIKAAGVTCLHMSPVARYWILTIPHHEFVPYLPPKVVYIRGQLERGEQGGYLHWQVLCTFGNGVRLAAVRAIFGGTCHAEPTRSVAAEAYVWKEDTAVQGTRFQLGKRPVKRNDSTDWDAIREWAKAGQLEEVPADVYIRCYQSLRTIARDNLRADPMEREVFVFWGRTGTGKSRRAWDEATFEAYPKDPRTKFWDGYQGHENVVIDEFRGAIDISHMLRWLDRYPVTVEIKGSAVALKAKRIWITSNLDPRRWYPDADAETMAALLRRLRITHFNGNPFEQREAQIDE